MPDVRVRFIGTAASYSVGRQKFTQEKPVLSVDEETWKYLKKQKSPQGARLFMQSDDEEDDEVNDQQGGVPAGAFLTKKAAIDYARDILDVDLAETLSLETLNSQTFVLHQRYALGVRGEDLIQGLKFAQLAEGAEEGDVTVERGPGDEIDTAQGQGPDGDIQRPINQRVHGKRTDAHPVQKPRSQVAKPAKVREIGAEA